MESLILGFALATGVSCPEAFLESLARLGKKNLHELHRFAEVACETNNPDFLWQIAYVESYFEPGVVRINDSEAGTILRGPEAVSALQKLKRGLLSTDNVDVGILQVNWRYHHKKFASDPAKIKEPEGQIRYLVSTLASDLFSRCGALWLGCYHSGSYNSRTVNYAKKIEAAGAKLKKTISSTKKSLSGEAQRKGRGVSKGQTVFYFGNSQLFNQNNGYVDQVKGTRPRKPARSRGNGGIVDQIFD